VEEWPGNGLGDKTKIRSGYLVGGWVELRTLLKKVFFKTPTQASTGSPFTVDILISLLISHNYVGW